jgi:hypothetical protein
MKCNSRKNQSSHGKHDENCATRTFQSCSWQRCKLNFQYFFALQNVQTIFVSYKVLNGNRQFSYVYLLSLTEFIWDWLVYTLIAITVVLVAVALLIFVKNWHLIFYCSNIAKSENAMLWRMLSRLETCIVYCCIWRIDLAKSIVPRKTWPTVLLVPITSREKTWQTMHDGLYISNNTP